MPARVCCADEAAQKSAHSASGPVEDDEQLIRIVYRADQLDPETGFLAPLAIKSDELKRIRDGFSVNRLKHLTAAKYTVLVGVFVGLKAGNVYHGAGVVSAGMLRAILAENVDPCLCVIDDGTLASDPFPANDAHALVHCADKYPVEYEAAKVIVDANTKQNANRRLNQIIERMRDAIIEAVGPIKTPVEIEALPFVVGG